MTAYYNEFDPGAAAWLRELIKKGLIADGTVDERSILDVAADDLRGFTQCHFFAGIGGWSYALRLAGWPDDRPVWTGSPPCQPFSAAGQQLGRQDARHLAPHFISLVGAARPAVLFGEQVASAEVFGKAASGAGKRAAGPPQWAWLDDLSDRLETARYAVGASDFPSAGVGAPHIRQRTFFGAVSHEWLANADAGVAQQSARQGARSNETEGWRSHGEPSRRGDAGGLADSAGLGWDGRRSGEAGDEPGTQQRLDGFCDAGGLGNSLSSGLEGHGGHGDGSREPGRIDQDAAGSVASASAVDGVGHPDRLGTGRDAGSGCGPETGEGRRGCGHDAGASGDPLRPGPLHGFWADADWLFCRDGKWRPVEPGTFPLAHGVSGRVGLLRGYGNAINPHAGAKFIEAFDASIRHFQLEPDGDIFG